MIRDISQFSPVLSSNQCSVLTSTQFSPALSSHQHSVSPSTVFSPVLSSHQFSVLTSTQFSSVLSSSPQQCWFDFWTPLLGGLRNIFFGAPNGYKEMAGLSTAKTFAPKFEIQTRGLRNNETGGSATVFLGLCNSFTAGGLLNNQLSSGWICVAIILGASSSCLPKPCPWQRNGRRVTYWTGLTTWGAPQQ